MLWLLLTLFYTNCGFDFEDSGYVCGVFEQCSYLIFVVIDSKVDVVYNFMLFYLMVFLKLY